MENDKLPTMIVDDHIENMALLEQSLQSINFPSLFVNSGIDPLKIIHDAKLALALLSIELREQQQELAKMHKQLEISIITDTITELSNDVYFTEYVQKHINSYKKNNSDKFSIILVNIYNVQPIIQVISKERFNKILHDVGQILNNLDQDYSNFFLAYLGNNQFGILVPESNTSNNFKDLSSKIIDVLKVPFNTQEDNVFLSINIGVAYMNDNYDNANNIITDAITAATTFNIDEESKPISYYNELIGISAKENLKLETELHNAIANKEFIQHYQPIVDLENNKTAGFEVLLRWQHPQHGLLSPDKFITYLEKFNLIDAVTEEIIITSINVIKKWVDYDKTKDFSMHINVSPSSLQNKNFSAMLLKTLEANKDYVPYIKLEITEDLLIISYETVKQLLLQMRSIGVKFALDDFGKGYSSLTHLHELHFNTIKIDKLFIDNINDNIIKMIITLSHSMDMTCVAEGVETKEQVELLKILGCDYVQGYYFSKPLSEADAENFLHNYNPI